MRKKDYDIGTTLGRLAAIPSPLRHAEPSLTALPRRSGGYGEVKLATRVDGQLFAVKVVQKAVVVDMPSQVSRLSRLSARLSP